MRKNLFFFLVSFSFFFPSFADKISYNSINLTVLSGDVGGTNVKLRLSRLKNGKKYTLADKVYKAANYNNIITIIHLFLSKLNYNTSNIKSLCLGVAGPVTDNKVKLFRSGWLISAEQLKSALKINKVLLINDFEAIGHGIETLTMKDLYTLQKGTPIKKGLKAFIGAGTGFGVGFASWNRDQYTIHPSQGGLSSFSPSNDIQIDILKYLNKKKYSTVFIGKLLSGSGIIDIYNYFMDINPFNDEKDKKIKILLEKRKFNITPALITKLSLNHQNKMAVRTLNTFTDIYGSEARNIAYTLLPKGGLYITGGIAPKILNGSFSKRFIHAFSNKSHLSKLLKDIPIWVILNTNVGLQGAENCAFKLALEN